MFLASVFAFEANGLGGMEGSGMADDNALNSYDEMVLNFVPMLYERNCAILGNYSILHTLPCFCLLLGMTI